MTTLIHKIQMNSVDRFLFFSNENDFVVPCLWGIRLGKNVVGVKGLCSPPFLLCSTS